MLTPGHILDLYDDAEGVHLRDGKILEKFGSKIEIDRACDLAKLKDKDFALVLVTKTAELHRKFPVHTPDALAVSTHYFEKTGSSLPEDARRIAASNLALAYARFGATAPEEVLKLASKDIESPYFSSARTPAVSEIPAAQEIYSEKYAFSREMADGSKVEMFPVGSINHCRESIAEFQKNAHQFSGGDRHKIATALLENFKEVLGGILPSVSGDIPVESDHYIHALQKMASLDPNPAFMSYIGARMPYLTEENQQTLSSLVNLAGALPGTKIAEAIEAFDRKSGLAHLWDIRIQNPWNTCFQQKTESVKVGERAVTAADVLRLVDSGKLDSMFKKATLAEIRKQPLEVYSSLPDPLKREIAGLL